METGDIMTNGRHSFTCIRVIPGEQRDGYDAFVFRAGYGTTIGPYTLDQIEASGYKVRKRETR